MASGFADRVLNLESGLLHTAWLLLVAPGRVVREYLAGRTLPYVHPIGYMVLSFAAFALSAQVSGGSGGGNDRVFVALLIPFVAVASRVTFLRAGLSLAEHLIVAAYLLGHTALMLALLQLPMGLVSVGVARVLVYPMLALVAGWLIWAYTRIFSARPALAALGGLASLALGLVTWGGFMVLLIRALR